jgi:hypothetical protein
MRRIAVPPSLLVLIPAFGGATTVRAGSPVDPSILSPAPPSTYSVTCEADGATTVCTGTGVETFVDLDLGPQGSACEDGA